jgi:membrane-bound ClpP family serine protease
MCHIIFALPILTLPLFYFLPLEWALPLYVFVLILSFGLYYLVFDAMRKPVVTGREAMIGSFADALTDIEKTGKVRYKNEMWSAESKDSIKKGESVRILDYKWGELIVEKCRINEKKFEIEKCCSGKLKGLFFKRLFPEKEAKIQR